MVMITQKHCLLYCREIMKTLLCVSWAFLTFLHLQVQVRANKQENGASLHPKTALNRHYYILEKNRITEVQYNLL